jgi:transcriptional regulator
MYVPPQFRLKDRDDALDLIRDYPFAAVVSVLDGSPVVSHLPVIVTGTEPSIVLAAHFARANPHWKCVESSAPTLFFHGPHGYISPRWYTNPEHTVPTWNYAIVRITAQARIVDPAATRDIVESLTREMEAGAPNAWTVDRVEPSYLDSQLPAIVGVHFTVQTIEASFKLGQNRNEADRSGAIAGLRSTGRESDRDLAELMERFAPKL